MKVDTQWLPLVLASALIVACGGSPSPQNTGNTNPAPSISSLGPPSRPAGSTDITLTVTGSGFVSASTVQWNGSNRTTSFVSATQLNSTILSSDLAIAGSAQVSVVNPAPGGGTSSAASFIIASQIANGIALTGDPNSRAIDATTNLHETNVDGGSIDRGIAMNRLSVFFAHDATVGQVNSALGSIGAGIVSMSPGITAFTLGIPKQPSLEALQILVGQLQASPGVHHAGVANVPTNNVIFPGGSISFADMAAIVRHLLPGRFPAAWNAADAAKFGNPSSPQTLPCVTAAVPIIVNDAFFANPPPEITGLFASLHLAAAPPSNVPSSIDLSHGYDVARVLGASAVGANPFSLTSACVDVSLVQMIELGFSDDDDTDNLISHMPDPGTKFVVNESRGNGGCSNPAACQPPHDRLSLAIDRAYNALYYKARTKSRWSDFLFVASAGNARDKDAAAIYTGVGDSRFNSPRTMAQLPDPNFGPLADDTLWTPSAADVARDFVSIKATGPEMDTLKQDLADYGLSGPDSIADNVIVVGSVTSPTPGSELTQHVTNDQLSESVFSQSGPDVFAVGENVLNNSDLEGTSFAAPQVAGLAAYLWMLSPDLRNQPVSTTKRIIVANTRNKVIDAYASVLALDGTTLSQASAPIRFALLNVHNDDNQPPVFDEQDLAEFLEHLFVSTDTDITHQPAPATTADFSRWDLNGDGFTTAGSRRERFDLDRLGSTQFGTTLYSTISQTIEGQEVRFDETALTDLEILCYYAYSPLYTGNTDIRKTLLDGRCGLTIQPASATLNPGQQQQFTANTPTGDPVTWTVTGAGNSISNSGLLTAGSTAGSFTVQAIDSANSSLTATATVTISASDACAAGLKNVNKYLQVGVFDRVGGDVKSTATELTQSNSFMSTDSNELGTAGYFSADVKITDNNTGRDIPGGSGIQAGVNDAVFIIPSDPALMGTPMNVTGTLTMNATAQVSGGHATAGWFLTFSMGGSDSTNASAMISNVSGQNLGNIDGGTFSASNPSIFGAVIFPSAMLEVVTGYACDPAHESCPAQGAAGTGTAQAHATLQWGQMRVTDQAGNLVGFSQCSVSGITY